MGSWVCLLRINEKNACWNPEYKDGLIRGRPKQQMECLRLLYVEGVTGMTQQRQEKIDKEEKRGGDQETKRRTQLLFHLPCSQGFSSWSTPPFPSPLSNPSTTFSTGAHPAPISSLALRNQTALPSFHKGLRQTLVEHFLQGLPICLYLLNDKLL